MAQSSGRLGQPAHHRIQHIETHVVGGSRDRRLQPDALRLHCFGHGRFSLPRQLHSLIETVGADSRCIIVTLQEFVPARNAFLVTAEYHPINERQQLARVCQQACLFIFRHPLGRISLTMKIGILLQYHHPIRIILGEHVRPGANGIPVKRDILFRQPRLSVKTFCLPRDRREKRHRQPVHELRVLTLNLDAVRVSIHHLRTFQRIAVQIQITVLALLPSLRPGCRLQGRGIFFETDNVIRHQTKNRRMQPGVRQPLDLEYIVFCGQLARAATGKIAKLVNLSQILGSQIVIKELPLLIFGECRMRLIANAGADGNFINCISDLHSINIVWQLRTILIEILCHRHLGRCCWNQRIGTFQIMVLQRRFVNLCSQQNFVGTVRLHRIKVFGALGKRTIEDIFPRIGSGIGTIPGITATGGQQNHKRSQQVFEQSLHWRDSLA